MKIIFGTAALLCGFLCLVSCSRHDYPELHFHPGAITVEVGQSTTVQFTIEGETEGLGMCEFSSKPEGIVTISTDRNDYNTLTITGVTAGRTVIIGTMDDNPSVTGMMNVTITE